MHKLKKPHQLNKECMKEENFKQNFYYNLCNINEAYATLHVLRYVLLSEFIHHYHLAKRDASSEWWNSPVPQFEKSNVQTTSPHDSQKCPFWSPNKHYAAGKQHILNKTSLLLTRGVLFRMVGQEKGQHDIFPTDGLEKLLLSHCWNTRGGNRHSGNGTDEQLWSGHLCNTAPWATHEIVSTLTSAFSSDSIWTFWNICRLNNRGFFPTQNRY